MPETPKQLVTNVSPGIRWCLHNCLKLPLATDRPTTSLRPTPARGQTNEISLKIATTTKTILASIIINDIMKFQLVLCSKLIEQTETRVRTLTRLRVHCLYVKSLRLKIALILMANNSNSVHLLYQAFAKQSYLAFGQNNVRWLCLARQKTKQ